MFGTIRESEGRWLLGAALLWLVAASCSGDKDLVNVENTAPEIRGISASLDTLALGERTELTCHAIDAELDLITFSWSTDASEGAFFGSTSDSTINWKPNEGFEGTTTIQVVASDRKAESAPMTIDLLVVGETGSLTGTVFDRMTNLPIESAVVEASGRTATTSAAGVYLIDTLPLGLHTITISLEGYAPFEQPNVDVRSSETVVDITLTPLALVGSVTGFVRNSQGNPLEGANCRIGDLVALSGADGSYTIKGVLREQHVLQVSRDGYLFFSDTINVDSEILSYIVTLDARRPSAPANVTAAKSGTMITITWPESPDDTVEEYQIHQRIDNESTMEIPGARVDATTREYVVSGEVDRRYRYRVSAFNFEGEQSALTAVSNMIVLTPLTAQVEVAGGPIVVGATPDGWIGDPWGTEDHPANPVQVGTFSVDVHEVTNRQYSAYLYESRSTGAIMITGDGSDAGAYAGDTRLLNFNASKLRLDTSSDNGDFAIVEGFEEHPVVGVTWHGAAAYAEHFGLRLPTEVEWEKLRAGRLARTGRIQERTWDMGLRFRGETNPPRSVSLTSEIWSRGRFRSPAWKRERQHTGLVRSTISLGMRGSGARTGLEATRVLMLHRPPGP